MAFEGTLKVTCFELPDLYCTVLRRCRQLSVLWMEGQTCYVRFMTFQLEFSRRLRQVQLLNWDVFVAFFSGTLREVVLQVLDLFLEVGDLFLKRKDGLPFELEFVSFGVYIGQTGADFLGEGLGCFGVLALDQVLENVAVELVLLACCQHHLQFNCYLIL